MLKHNSKTILECDVLRPIDNSVEYYAVLDVSFSVTGVTLVRNPSLPQVCSGEYVSEQAQKAVHNSTLHLKRRMPGMTKPPMETIYSVGDLGTVSVTLCSQQSDDSDYAISEQSEQSEPDDCSDNPPDTGVGEDGETCSSLNEAHEGGLIDNNAKGSELSPVCNGLHLASNYTMCAELSIEDESRVDHSSLTAIPINSKDAMFTVSVTILCAMCGLMIGLAWPKRR